MSAPADPRIDQAQAREREFDRLAHKSSVVVMSAAGAIGAYCVVALAGLAPLAPWAAAAG